jgi:hypothetical protein
MDCRQAQDEILEGLGADEHIAVCPVCAEFARRQKALDARLSAVLTPPELSATFRSNLKARIRRESPRMWPDVLPDLVHFASCAAATVLCAVLLPFAAGAVLAAGAVATVITYLLITAARIWFEA